MYIVENEQKTSKSRSGYIIKTMVMNKTQEKNFPVTGRVIAVWGSPSSGKTTLCAVLAKQFARKNRNVLLLSFDTCVPALPIWFPHTEPKGSIGSLLTSLTLTAGDIADKITLYPRDERIGVLAAVREENLVTYPEIGKDMVYRLLDAAKKLCEYIIVDCNSNFMFDMLSLIALERADAVIRLQTPDARGMLYHASQLAVLDGEIFNTGRHVKVCNLVKEYHPLEETANAAGGFDAVLPFNEELESKYLTGKLFEEFYTRKGKEYVKSCNKLLSMVKGSGF